MEKININKTKISELSNEDIQDILNIQKEQKIYISSKENILNDLEHTNFKYFTLKYENRIIGYISFSHVIDIEIEAIVIKKDFQRLGLGTLLLNFVFEFAKTNNIENIFLEVRVSNTPARKLYDKCGFKEINIRKNYYKDNNEDAIILIKKCSS